MTPNRILQWDPNGVKNLIMRYLDSGLSLPQAILADRWFKKGDLGGIWGCVGQRDQARKTWRPIWWWRGAYGQHRLMRWRWIWFLKKAIDSEKRNQWLFSKSILRPYMTI